MKTMSPVRRMAECAVLVALATVLSLIKLIDLPYGGSVTAASALPIVILAYRHGLKYSLPSALVYAVVQQLLGLKSLSYVTGWQSVLAVILLDYIIAFAVLGFGGVFRPLKAPQAVCLTAGAFLVCLLRYVCHVISGATVWAGLSIPDSAALLYSLGYNATYMVPETLILVAAMLYLGNLIDFTADMPTRLRFSERMRVDKVGKVLYPATGFVVLAAVVYIVIAVFSHLQNADTGSFDFTGADAVSWGAVIAVGAVALVAFAAAFAYACVSGTKNSENSEKN